MATGGSVDVAPRQDKNDKTNLTHTGLLMEECGWKDGGRGGSVRYVAARQDKNDKTNLTHTGLLMEGPWDYQVPETVVVLAVEAADCLTVGGAMHPAVCAAIPVLLEKVRETIESVNLPLGTTTAAV